ncbi:hypothetical protein [Nesterenkonia sandarakina]|uniref:Uncharacterized protein n=1 Tax=Nesterenkonia sandarakina TaxID=272918 RepID=A0A2T0YQW0_9MICC|nr:hypothetical protein [Nesterenkonia sandarakina]PRZ17802.1 hypothetical protein BCL67_104152 [Nesterenkonia sandarakina]
MAAEVTASRRRATGRTLLIVSALGAAGFAGWSLAQLQLTTPETFLSEAWHAFGLIVFAGLFALVAWRPRAYPGLMELTIVHSIGMFVLAFTNQDAEGATATMILHGLLALALLIAYVVLGCIKAWGHQPAAQPSPTRTGTTRDAATRSSSTSNSPTREPAGTKGSAAQGTPNREPAGTPRGIDRTPEAPTQPAAAAPRSAPGSEPRPQQAQPTKPMPRELPEDRPLS